ncbi:MULTISPECIES: low specificity L-threonine aldolase [unclassified Achromobacter]|uniref:threonine aldolase family protein n=1 Tax=unclassified Achromobacter TaxID=2626865 RepID=UPI000B515015|nr:MULTISPECIES: GntG family PLP-dependent aldolase [unclassified Achromobacter]OWT74336.1 threonine aldolase [Achromobacter sp. HZ34]OWT78803.1 threonine aldolase [Achromobacter sp. HZ28]
MAASTSTSVSASVQTELPGHFVDLRSDTVTRPTEAMLEAMRAAPIGDDGLDGDPSVRQLESTVAALLGKDAGLFVPSCTMANLLAVLAQTASHEQLVLESNAHMYTSERGAATFTNLFYLAVPGVDGAMDLQRLAESVPGGGHKLKTSLVAMETSHNNAAGAVPSLDYMRAVREIAAAHGSAVHLDGARLFNAAVALGVAPAVIAQHTDTVSLCLSKGLSAPVGAVLSGPQAVMERARSLRRMIGGTQRQAGLMAAAGLYAVEHMGARLAQDHVRARLLSDGVNALQGVISATVPQTNIIQIDVSRSGRDSATWVRDLQAAGLAVRPWGATRLRCVTHRHIDDSHIERALASIRAVLAEGV